MNGLGPTCRDLRLTAEAEPPGPRRDQMLSDLDDLRSRLSTLPAKVAARAEMRSAAEVRAVLHDEIQAAFATVLSWTV